MIIITILALIVLHRKTALYKAGLPARYFSTWECQGTFFGLLNSFLALISQDRKTLKQVQITGVNILNAAPSCFY